MADFLFGGIEDAKDDDLQGDPDITAMALQALAKYQDRPDVKNATGKALICLSELQNNKGGYTGWGKDNIESVAQVIVALTELGIPLDDSRFVKNGKTLPDNLMTFYIKGRGFCHIADGGSDQMATEQGFYALVAAERAQKGKNSLYSMTEVSITEDKVRDMFAQFIDYIYSSDRARFPLAFLLRRGYILLVGY